MTFLSFFHLVINLIAIALFGFAILLTLRLSPKMELSTIVTADEKKICESNYKWLRNSSFITVPVFLIAVSFLHPVLATIIPMIFHISLIRKLKTNSLYVYRHTQQALCLILLRAGTAALIFSFFYSGGFVLFLLANGLLWLFGTNWGISQVNRGDCWLMQRKGEKIILPETTEPEKPDNPIVDTELDDMLKSLDAKGTLAAKQKALDAFRTGTLKIKKRAVEVLSKLGEVEKF